VFIAKALSPAVVEKVGVTEEDRAALAVVADAQLSLAIGKKGQNVRLAAKLTGWKIDILSESEYEQERQKERDQEIEAAIAEETRKMAEETEAAETMEAEAAAPAPAPEEPQSELTGIDGVGPKTAEQLIQAGYDTVAKVAAMSDEEILAVPGIGDRTAQKILLSARELLKKS
jgi:predicted flap endonuclease-1-like 5' DNA nuclease